MKVCQSHIIALFFTCFVTRVAAFTTPTSSAAGRDLLSVRKSSTLLRVEENDGVDVKEEQDEVPVYYNIASQEAGPLSSAGSETSDLFNAQMEAQRSAAATTTVPSYSTLNGWYPKEDYALWGLPGAIAPTGFFDPLGFARRGLPLNDAKRLREAEVQHSRVAMVAVVGYIAGEQIRSPLGITGPANDQLQQVPLPLMILLTIGIATAELYRAKRGWVEPTFRIGSGTLWTLRDSYYPGDLGFDPLGFKPTENYAFQRIQTAELSNGRLAMLGWAGMCSQELVNHRTIGETLDFYRMVFTGESDPYGFY